MAIVPGRACCRWEAPSQHPGLSTLLDVVAELLIVIACFFFPATSWCFLFLHSSFFWFSFSDHGIPKKVIPVTAMVLRPHFNDMEYKLRPGMITLTWTSMNIDTYKGQVRSTTLSSTGGDSTLYREGRRISNGSYKRYYKNASQLAVGQK